MTNIIKQTLIDKRLSNEERLDAIKKQKANLVIKRAQDSFHEVLTDFPDVHLKSSWSDVICFDMNDKNILSINCMNWTGSGRYYLNTYATTIETEFEYRRLIFNGRIATIIHNGGMDDFISAIFVSDGLMAIYDEEAKLLRVEQHSLALEITKIDKEEKQKKQEIALENLYSGNIIVLSKVSTVDYGRGKYDIINRVSQLRCLNKNTSGNKVTIEFTCLSYDMDSEITRVVEGIQIKYLLNYI
jgi:hypothetical protein